jgi:hypothetical protein
LTPELIVIRKIPIGDQLQRMGRAMPPAVRQRLHQVPALRAAGDAVVSSIRRVDIGHQQVLLDMSITGCEDGLRGYRWASTGGRR